MVVRAVHGIIKIMYMNFMVNGVVEEFLSTNK